MKLDLVDIMKGGNEMKLKLSNFFSKYFNEGT
jgi:hypothetical protein